ncbi:hypothetical protein [Paenibacillus tengchongensis]|uniref:hypothetical protein n=1 Tax=Paenibacillus tengchongensis TaxID=2608684 RepID=UPI00124E369A|nr:hypothetical protein [Paenibacillus tengchongensis]
MDSHKEEDKLNQPRRKVVLRPRRVDYPRRDKTQSEEYAAEISPLPASVDRNDLITMEDAGAGSDSKSLGYIGLGFGLVSLFIWSIILGPIAAIIGYYAFSKGQKTAGAWAMGLGLVSALSYFVLIPFAQ